MAALRGSLGYLIHRRVPVPEGVRADAVPAMALAVWRAVQVGAYAGADWAFL